MEKNMNFNKKLFHLGNDVVELQKKIEKEFPVKSPLEGLNDCFLDLLKLINNIRLAIQQSEDPIDCLINCYEIKVSCKDEELAEIRDYLDTLDLNFNVRMITDHK